MRLYVALVVLGLLALSALATDAERGPGIPMSGAAPCGRPALDRNVSGDRTYDGWFQGLVRVTCDLDGALLWMENYYRADLGDTLTGGLPARRHRPDR